jgi:cytochrome c oxidase cbb3-type subunit 3
MSHLRPVFPALVMLLAAGGACAQTDLDERLLQASPTTIEADAALLQHMNTLAESAYAANCSACHGADYTGDKGVPDLSDYEWLWAIDGSEPTSAEPVFAIMQTILYGIRDRDCADSVKRYGACPDTRYSEMPAYGSEAIGFSDQELDDLVDYVFMLSGQEFSADAVARAAPNSVLCAECHGPDGYGYRPYGGPDLTDGVWLHGGTREQIREVLKNGSLGNCPPWTGKLDMVTIKALAVYLYRKSMGN